MSVISVGSAVGAGFQLIGKRPLSVLFWGLLRVGFVAVFFAIYAPVLFSVFSQAAAAGASGQPPQAAVAGMMSQMIMLQGLGFLVQIVSLFLTSMIYCAIVRAVIHPERRAFGSVRLGGPEFFVVVVSFAASFAFAFCLVIFMIPVAIAVGVLAAQHQFVAMGIVIGLAILVLVLGLILVGLRFAFVVPMMVEDGKFHLFESWGLTKGHVGSLFLIGLCLMLVGFLLEIVIGLIFVALVLGTLTFAAGGFEAIPTFFQSHQANPAALIPILAPSLILLVALLIPVEGAVLAIFIAPWARAYRDVVPGPMLSQPIVPPPAAAPLAAVP
jgi:hypothetical protein